MEMESLVWRVPNFTEILTATRKLQFINNKPRTHKFSIIMRLFGHENDLIEIYYMSPVSVSLIFGIRAYIPNHNIGGKSEYHTVQGGRWQYIATIPKKRFTSEYLNCNALHLVFQYKINNIDDKASSIEAIENSNYLKQLLSNGQFSDIITIKSAEGKEHKVHKELLAIRSPVFKAQFEHNMIECQTNTIETHLENEVLDEVLTFIYSSKASREKDMSMKLLAAADFYQISQLKSLCETALYENLSPENAIDTLIHADLYSAETLKKLTLEFIRFEPHIVIKDEVWAELKSVELLKSLCKCILDTNVVCFDVTN